LGLPFNPFDFIDLKLSTAEESMDNSGQIIVKAIMKKAKGNLFI
jgi:hypothetical protein